MAPRLGSSLTHASLVGVCWFRRKNDSGQENASHASPFQASREPRFNAGQQAQTLSSHSPFLPLLSKSSGILPHSLDYLMVGFPVGSVVKNLPVNAGDVSSIPEKGKIPWRKKWQPTSVFLPGESNGQRSLAGDSSWGHKGLVTTEHGCNKYDNDNNRHCYQALTVYSRERSQEEMGSSFKCVT